MNWELRHGDGPKELHVWWLGYGYEDSILVHHELGDAGTWVLTCFNLRIRGHKLVSLEILEAKLEALRIVSNRLLEITSYYKRLGVVTLL